MPFSYPRSKRRHKTPLPLTLAHSALERIKQRAQAAAHDLSHTHATTHTLVDVSVQFIGARELPKMDVVGSADPYFVATIDGKVKFTSTVQPDTLSPVWNELWHVKNVPSDGALHVEVWDKDDGAPGDDYIGACDVDLMEGTKEAVLEGRGRAKKNRGTLWAKVTTAPASTPTLPLYTFDGPISFSRHFSPTLGLLTNTTSTQPDANTARLYSTWKLRLKHVPHILGPCPPQHWNTAYPAAQRIFGTGPTCLAVRSSIQAGHRMLYARSTRNGFGVIEGAKDVMQLMKGGRVKGERVKPAVYTYIISAEDDTLRFSETGAAFFVDFASKHALHANCAEYVRYSGEFHPRPAVPGGWEGFDEEKLSDTEVGWEIVVDNNSGTYAPDKNLLPHVKELIEFNFPGFGVVALDRGNEELERSREACRAYAVKWRKEEKRELQPHTGEGEETLSARASVGGIRPKQRIAEDMEGEEVGSGKQTADELV